MTDVKINIAAKNRYGVTLTDATKRASKERKGLESNTNDRNGGGWLLFMEGQSQLIR
jgi:hypothetical protein